MTAVSRSLTYVRSVSSSSAKMNSFLRAERRFSSFISLICFKSWSAVVVDEVSEEKELAVRTPAEVAGEADGKTTQSLLEKDPSEIPDSLSRSSESSQSWCELSWMPRVASRRPL